MRKIPFDPKDRAELIEKALQKGILLNTQDEKFNTMVIGWGALGITWRRPTFKVYVREGRYTRSALDRTREFTVSIPSGPVDPQIHYICGKKSGRDIDKAKEAHLTLCEPETVCSPGILEYPLTLECRVLFSGVLRKEELSEEVRTACYPGTRDSSHAGANSDDHIMYIGEIVNAYVLEPDPPVRGLE